MLDLICYVVFDIYDESEQSRLYLKNYFKIIDKLVLYV